MQKERANQITFAVCVFLYRFFSYVFPFITFHLMFFYRSPHWPATTFMTFNNFFSRFHQCRGQCVKVINHTTCVLKLSLHPLWLWLWLLLRLLLPFDRMMIIGIIESACWLTIPWNQLSLVMCHVCVCVFLTHIAQQQQQQQYKFILKIKQCKCTKDRREVYVCMCVCNCYCGCH